MNDPSSDSSTFWAAQSFREIANKLRAMLEEDTSMSDEDRASLEQSLETIEAAAVRAEQRSSPEPKQGRVRGAIDTAHRIVAAAYHAGARVVAAALRIEATALNDANPGVRITNAKPVTLWYYDGAVTLPAGTELVIEGWHNPSGDEMLGYEDLDLPDPQAANSPVNLRVRVKDQDGNELLLTTQELRSSFDAVASQEEELLDPSLEMPGESVWQDEPRVPSMRDLREEKTPDQRRRPAPKPSLSQPLAPGETGLETTDLRPSLR